MIPLKVDIPAYRTPYVNWFLIAANVAVFGYEWSLPLPRLEALVSL